MAGISYRRLFNTRILHTFYEEGVSKKDLAVIPLDSTASTMKNSNLLFRADEEGFRVLYKAEELSGSPFIAFGNVNLVFALQLLNVNEFLNFTNLGAGAKTYVAGKIIYFTNRGGVTVNNLSYSLIDYLRPTSFTYQFPQTATGPTDTANIIIKDLAGNVVTPIYPPSTLILPDENNKYNYPIDLSKLPKGLYKFDTWKTAFPNPIDHTIESIYIDNDLARTGVFGIVDIFVEDYNELPTDRIYNMNFERRLTKWKYIVVLKSPSVTPAPAPANISIEDTSVTPFQPPYGKLLFNGGVAGPLVNGFPSVIITSVTPLTIPYFEVSKKALTVKNLTTAVVTDIQGPPIGVVSAQTTPTIDFNITEIFVTI